MKQPYSSRAPYSGRTLDELREKYTRIGIDPAGRRKQWDFDGNAFIIQNCGRNWGVFNEQGIPVYGMGRVDEFNYLKYRLIEHDIKEKQYSV